MSPPAFCELLAKTLETPDKLRPEIPLLDDQVHLSVPLHGTECKPIGERVTQQEDGAEQERRDSECDTAWSG